MIERTFCTTREAARILGVSVRTTQLWVEKGLLTAWKTDGGHRRVSRESVELLLYKRPAVAVPEPPRPFTVLVIEDDRYLLRLYQMTLSRWPLAPRVFTATNGIEALVQIGRETPDLLLVDLQMPDMDGFHLLRVVRSMAVLSGMAIAVVTGLDSAEISRRGPCPSISWPSLRPNWPLRRSWPKVRSPDARPSPALHA
jgi:excisionase family DNA binding protein